MPRTNDSFFNALGKGRLVLALLLILQVGLLVLLLQREGPDRRQHPAQLQPDPCIHQFELKPDRGNSRDGCLLSPTRVRGRA